MTNKEREEEVRRAIAKTHKKDCGDCCHKKLSPYKHSTLGDMPDISCGRAGFIDEICVYQNIRADQILSLKDSNGKPMIAILSENQDLTDNEHWHKSGFGVYCAGTNDMWAANFRRVIKEE